ncbi:hypothetical protein GCM10009641_28640 [Mycobacterium cookii]|uniref:Lipoprotein n=1 Tax=Nocardioides furvisabuli TaxID=375542 RepID=A0ABP5J5B9_9ACTN
MFLLALTACDGSTPEEDAPSGTSRQPSASSAPKNDTGVVFSRAGLTVRLPDGCRPKNVVPAQCQGLQALRVAEVGPSLDLMRPGVRQGRTGTWVGLRLVDESYVFAEASNAEVIYELFASASATTQ